MTIRRVRLDKVHPGFLIYRSYDRHIHVLMVFTPSTRGRWSCAGFHVFDDSVFRLVGAEAGTNT